MAQQKFRAFTETRMKDASALHNRAIVDQFGKQAASFAKLPAHDDATQLLLDAAQVGPDDTVLDAACGPGMVACAAAQRAQRVIGVDLTPEMLGQARALQARHGLTNIAWEQADV